ncbi:pyridoxamine 5'-phosphate oxidase [Nocardioides sp. BP30]|uniref:pyridoxamine 5'-phosphate oxidase n=1 Tax=Nocardioides sp. BP30 TaxID=3036374 RepID=UPI0024690997|nr:pyridoxamine 5'-phosphate oxidase [Nocardioides sp. BP30]WGL51985.1 pyridoxamine 5'-phosphate oxidase [Nocardioides sp. BP30]
MDLAAAREEYSRGGLSESDLAPDPVGMFERWYVEARDAGVREPNAMVVATTDPDGAPSARFVLLKGFDERGFVFYTNQASRKGQALAAEPRIALLFPWHDLERQVRVEGVAESLSRAEVEAYFAVRPRGSQLGAWASHQSRPVAGREELEQAYADVERRFAGVDRLPVPEEWGGYRVVPATVEFWQGRIGRMHDRLVYTRAGDTWATCRLAP